MDKQVQKVDGDWNQTAGNDINNTTNIYETHQPLRFSDNDLKEIILAFSSNTEAVAESFDYVYRPPQEKNRINNLSERYFRYINKEFLSSFRQVDLFLKNPINTKLLEKYENTVAELRPKIILFCNKNELFDGVFVELFDYMILEKGIEELKDKKKLVFLFLHYMYWNCDIGEKYDHAS